MQIIVLLLAQAFGDGVYQLLYLDVFGFEHDAVRSFSNPTQDAVLLHVGASHWTQL